jgi:hypothetical protein
MTLMLLVLYHSYMVLQMPRGHREESGPSGRGGVGYRGQDLVL